MYSGQEQELIKITGEERTVIHWCPNHSFSRNGSYTKSPFDLKLQICMGKFSIPKVTLNINWRNLVPSSKPMGHCKPEIMTTVKYRDSFVLESSPDWNINWEFL